MLHILNGDAAAHVLSRAGLPGEYLPWREALVAGPVPQEAGPDEWCRIRGAHLAAAYGADEAASLSSLLEQESALEGAGSHDEVVLWFEHDLFCQTILIYLLGRLAAMKIADGRISLVCIDRFPGIPGFRGLGQLAPEQMASLFERRQPVTQDQFGLAVRAWRSYTSPDPAPIQDLLAADTSPLPFLAPALAAHLRRFPSTGNGLGAIQNLALHALETEPMDFSTLFSRFSAAEPLYGYGDLQFRNDLMILAGMRQPLVMMKGMDDGMRTPAPESFGSATFRLTGMGRCVLPGDVDAAAIGGFDYWLGGVHVDDGMEWRWDAQQEQMVRIPAVNRDDTSTMAGRSD